jgi:hypothetical protein
MFFDPELGDDMFLQNGYELSADLTALDTKR